jgi:hypothetical protein
MFLRDCGSNQVHKDVATCCQIEYLVHYSLNVKFFIKYKKLLKLDSHEGLVGIFFSSI